MLTREQTPLNKKILSWCLFDFANSSYSAVISAVIFPVYYVNVVVGDQGEGDLWWGKAISFSMAIVAATSPILGGIADYTGMRKRLLFIYTYLCICATSAMCLLHGGMAMEGFLLVVLANIGLEGGLVFYNAFLPALADPAHQGRVSAWGFGTGYLGSILSLCVALLLVHYGIVKAVWPMVGIFFAIFSLPAFLFLPKDLGTTVSAPEAARKGLVHTWKNVKVIWSSPEPRKFLLAYFLYEDGVNTVIVFSSIFAATTLGFTPPELIGVYLIVQSTAFLGALVMAKPIDYRGPKSVVILTLIMWIAVSTATYFTRTKMHFLVIASFAGLGLGTIQAASRAFFTRFIPEGNEAEYFGVYSLVGKSSAVIGPLLFGYISALSGSQRPAALSIAFLFGAGLIILTRVQGGRPGAI
jgi:UMF1 family MFS transporter